MNQPPLAAALLLALCVPLAGQHNDTAEREIQRHLRDENWAKAQAKLEAWTAARPDDGRGWFLLAYALGQQGELKRAVEVGTKAATFAPSRGNALYNVACMQTRLGELDAAMASLHESRQAGFLDIDLAETDPDLEPLRGREDFPSPPRLEYDEFRAPNGVVIGYHVDVPADYDADSSYPTVVAFAPGNWKRRAADWMRTELFGREPNQAGLIVVTVVAPDRGWHTHPAHHALEALVRRVRRDYAVAPGRIAAFGLGQGARPATTYLRMSKRVFDTLITIGTTAWGTWKDTELARFRDQHIVEIFGSQDEHAQRQSERIATVFAESGFDYRQVIVPDSGPTAEGLRGAALLDLLAAQLRGDAPALGR
ncbi:MAG: hypothetical protein AAF628_27360 [Planctomycetota bacterium]